VSAAGARAALTDTWTTAVPETSGPLAIWETPGAPGDTRLRIGSQHGLLVAPGAMTLRASSGQILTPAIQEWVFPTVEDVVASTTISGTRTRVVPGGPAYRKPADVITTETCTWHFTRGNTSSRASTVSSSQASTATTVDQARPSITVAGTGTIGTIATPAPPTAAPGPPPATLDTGRRRDLPMTADAQQALADAATAAANAAAETTCGATSASATPCATISGPGRLTRGSTGDFLVALRNTPGATTVTVNHFNTDRTVSAIVTTRTDVTADFRFDSGEGESHNRVLTSVHSAPVLFAPVPATFTFQSAGTFAVVANVIITARMSIQTDRPVYDPNTKQQIRLDTVINEQTQVWNTSVRKALTVADR
jgi:hypothetical protein